MILLLHLHVLVISQVHANATTISWLGLSVAGSVELGHIVESPVIRAATSIVPLGWSGTPGDKNGQALQVEIAGFGLHMCTLVQAQVNGNWHRLCFTCSMNLNAMRSRLLVEAYLIRRIAEAYLILARHVTIDQQRRFGVLDSHLSRYSQRQPKLSYQSCAYCFLFFGLGNYSVGCKEC